jgi:hypothetical protein
VYPELHWDLTLRIARLPALGPGLLQEENLLALIRLPWFRCGVIPDEIRVALVRELDNDTEVVVRTEIIEVLERNLAPETSFAGAQQRLDVAVQRLFVHRRNWRKRLAAKRDLRRYPIESIARDRAVMRLLEEEQRSPAAFLLPKGLRARVFHEGVPLLGMHTAARAGSAVAVIAGLLLLQSPVARSGPDDSATGLLADDRPESTCETYGDTYNLRGECFDTPPRPLGPTIVPVGESDQQASPTVLAIRVSELGNATEVFVANSSANQTFDGDAIARARAIAYEPATLDGAPVSGWTEEAFFPEIESATIAADGGGTAVAVGQGGGTSGARRIVLSNSVLRLSAADRRPLASLVGATSELPADSVEWRSLQPDVAIVDSNGFLTALRAGEATLEASAASSSTARLLVRVDASPVTPTVGTMAVALGATRAVPLMEERTVTDSAQRRILARQVTWRSSDSSIVTISPEGDATGVSIGNATISVDPDGRNSRIAVTVHARPAYAYGDPPPLTTVTIPVGGARVFVGGLAAEDRTPIPEAPLHWQVLDTNVARFDPATGAAAGIRPGHTRLQFFDDERLVGAAWDLEVVPMDLGFTTDLIRLELGDSVMAPVVALASGTAIGVPSNFELRSLQPQTVSIGADNRSFVGLAYGVAQSLLVNEGQVMDTLNVFVRPTGVFGYVGDLGYSSGGIQGTVTSAATYQSGRVEFEDSEAGLRIRLWRDGMTRPVPCEAELEFTEFHEEEQGVGLNCVPEQYRMRPTTNSAHSGYRIRFDRQSIELRMRRIRISVQYVVNVRTCTARDGYGNCIAYDVTSTTQSTTRPASGEFLLKR